MALLADNRYGKHKVRVVRVTRAQGIHTVREWSVNVLIESDYDNAFRTGSNHEILPTDTMKNTVYSIARRSSASCIEDFAKELITHFLSTYKQAASVLIEIDEKVWTPLEVSGKPHPTSFQQCSRELQTTSVTASRAGGVSITSGLSNLIILKTAGSAFWGYIKDPLTTLRETSDRLFGTDVTASWSYDATDLPFMQLRAEIRAALLATFAGHNSLSVQHTLFAMAEAVLEQVPIVTGIKLTMPNKHCLLIDLSPFGQDNPNEIFVPTDEPHGYIEARVTR